jgi:hypothetical protein
VDPKAVLEWTRSRGHGRTLAPGRTLVRSTPHLSTLPRCLFHDSALFALFLLFLFPFLVNFYQDHVFMSIIPPNGLELSNLARKSTIEELREQIFPMWPTGAAHQERHGHDWRVTFAGSPWDSRGIESIMYVLGCSPIACFH